jgi:hypothetical protein
MLLAVPALFTALPSLQAQQPATPPELKKVSLPDGVELHY